MTAPNAPKTLTSGQARCAKAWTMVLVPSTTRRQFAFTGQRIADASGVSLRTVTSMREFLQAFKERGLTPSGVWLEDRERAIRMLGDHLTRPAPKRDERPMSRIITRAARVVLPRDPNAFGMKARLAGWRDAGWIGERWTKIADVDLWRQIAGHADRLGVSWQPAYGHRPGLWDAIATAIAKRASLSNDLSITPCRASAAHH